MRLLCLDASPKYVLLGSNIGSVYVFARRAPSGAPRDPVTDRASERDAHDAPLRFLDRFLVETHAGGSANKPIVALRLNPQHTRLVIAFEDGELEVVEFGEPGLGGEKKTGRVSGRYQAGIPECHRGAAITSLSWSARGDGFIGGDDRGVASLVILEGRDAGATTARFDAPLAQVSFLDDGSAAVVSTTERLYLLYREESFAKTAVGSKPRDGPFGAASHALARAGVPDDLRARPPMRLAARGASRAQAVGVPRDARRVRSGGTGGGDASTVRAAAVAAAGRRSPRETPETVGVWTRARRGTVSLVRVRARHRGGGLRRGDRVGVVSAERQR